LVQLSESLESFAALEVGVASSTYDAPATLSEFVSSRNIGFPVLSDEGGGLAKALGILNEQYEPGHPAHGVPHPGILFVDENGQILAKFAVEGHRQRPPLEDVLDGVRKLVN